MRTPWLPPNMASFKVPLNINKLDIKDYLWHAYGIPVLRVRSYIKQPPRARREDTGRWYRPRALKRMIIEMDDSYRGGPFAWPEEVKDLEPWDKKQFDAATKDQEKQRSTRAKYGRLGPREPGTLMEQVEALQRRKDVWRPTWAEKASFMGQHSGLGAPEELRQPGRD